MHNFSEIELIFEYSKTLKTGLMVDVGAHHGSSSRPFAENGWSIIAFEPEENNRAKFKKNLSKYKKVKVYSEAISDVNSENTQFYLSKKHYGIHSLKPFHKTHKPGPKITTVRLDTFLDQNMVTDVSILKIDIEGADFLALKSFDFSRYHPEIVMVEFMDSRSEKAFNYNHKDMITFMNKNKYSAYISEWKGVQEYAIEGVSTKKHQWIRCVPASSMQSPPAWGNIIFVDKKNKSKFEKILKHYITKVSISQKLSFIGKFCNTIRISLGKFKKTIINKSKKVI